MSHKLLILGIIISIVLVPKYTSARTIYLKKNFNLKEGDTINSDSVMDSIRKAKNTDTIDVSSLIISGEFDFSEAKITNVRCALNFSNTKFQGHANFFNTTFQREVNFNKAIFEKGSNFLYSIFQEKVDFEMAVFQGSFDFDKLIRRRIMHGKNSIHIAIKDNSIGITKGTYGPGYVRVEIKEGGTEFIYTTFQKVANFRNAEFQKSVDFIGTQFKSRTYFGGATFEEIMTFFSAIFQDEVDFYWTQFKSIANFIGVTFQSDVKFIDSAFHEESFFAKATFRGDADFREAKFFQGAKLLEAKFLKRVDFGGLHSLQPLSITWKQLDGHMTYNRANYAFVLKNFQQLGYTDDYDDCYYDFRVQIRRNESSWYSPSRFAEWVFLDLTCGYGVKPFRAIFWCILVIISFAWLYQMGGIKKRYHEKQPSNPRTKWKKFQDALIFSLSTFTTLRYGDWYPTEKRICLRFLNLEIPFLRIHTWAMLEGLIGWLLLALFLVTLSRRWIR